MNNTDIKKLYDQLKGGVISMFGISLLILGYCDKGNRSYFILGITNIPREIVCPSGFVKNLNHPGGDVIDALRINYPLGFAYLNRHTVMDYYKAVAYENSSEE